MVCTRGACAPSAHRNAHRVGEWAMLPLHRHVGGSAGVSFTTLTVHAAAAAADPRWMEGSQRIQTACKLG
eukprot:scaffold9114_cov118-Isochrysis_galbana.AAC.6